LRHATGAPAPAPVERGKYRLHQIRSVRKSISRTDRR